MPKKTIYLCKTEIAEEVKPFRLQYSIKEASYMLDTSEDTLMKWCRDYDCPVHKIGGKGKNYVLHDDLVKLIEDSKQVIDLLDAIYK